MARPKGLKKSGGRKKGTPNKTTFLLEEKLEHLNFDPVVELIICFDSLESGQKATTILKLLDYLYPKRKSIEIDRKSSPGINQSFAELVLAINEVSEN